MHSDEVHSTKSGQVVTDASSRAASPQVKAHILRRNGTTTHPVMTTHPGACRTGSRTSGAVRAGCDHGATNAATMRPGSDRPRPQPQPPDAAGIRRRHTSDELAAATDGLAARRAALRRTRPRPEPAAAPTT